MKQTILILIGLILAIFLVSCDKNEGAYVIPNQTAKDTIPHLFHIDGETGAANLVYVHYIPGDTIYYNPLHTNMPDFTLRKGEWFFFKDQGTYPDLTFTIRIWRDGCLLKEWVNHPVGQSTQINYRYTE